MQYKKVAEKFLKGLVVGSLGAGAVTLPNEAKEALLVAAAGLLVGFLEAATNYLKHRTK